MKEKQRWERANKRGRLKKSETVLLIKLLPKLNLKAAPGAGEKKKFVTMRRLAEQPVQPTDINISVTEFDTQHGVGV